MYLANTKLTGGSAVVGMCTKYQRLLLLVAAQFGSIVFISETNDLITDYILPNPLLLVAFVSSHEIVCCMDIKVRVALTLILCGLRGHLLVYSRLDGCG